MAKTDWQMGDTVLPDDLNQIGQEINQNRDNLAAHTAATTSVHGATSAATPNTLVQRDAQGRIKAAAPAAADDVARKAEVDVAQTNLNTHKSASTLDHPDGSVTTAKLADGAVTSTKLASGAATDTAIGNRTISDSSSPSSDSGTLTNLLSWLAYMIRSITGKSSWRTAPATTLEAAANHINTTTGVHGATSAATPNTLVQRDGSGRIKAAAPAASDDVARKAEVDAVQNSLSGHIGSGGSAHAVATTSQAGFMSAADKSKLNGIEAGAQVNTVTSVAGKTGAVTLSKSDVGLGNVQNYGIASQSQAQAGTDNASYMTPLRTKQAIDQFVPIETGVWTPELRFGGSTAGITYAYRWGRYTRIANVVYWMVEIDLSSKGSASGAAAIAGLPFNKVAGLDFYHAVGRASNISVPSGQWLSSYIVSTTVYLATNTGSDISSAAFANTSSLRASGFYFI